MADLYYYDDINTHVYVMELNLLVVMNIPSLWIITVDDEISKDNEKQLGNSLIATLKVAFSLRDRSSTIPMLNDDDNDPAEIVMLKTAADTM